MKNKKISSQDALYGYQYCLNHSECKIQIDVRVFLNVRKIGKTVESSEK